MAILFFDIDGTLWDKKNVIPDSTVTGLRRAKENGHRLFICTGRTKAFVFDKNLLSLGFEGFSFGCGTHLEYQGRDCYYHGIPREQILDTVRTFRRYGMGVIVEGRQNLFIDTDVVGADAYGKRVMETLGERMRTIAGQEDVIEGSKYIVLIEGTDYPACIRELSADYDAAVHGGRAMEIVPKGFSKATGMRRMCELIHADPADTFAFGDSPNDLDMLDCAGTAVVMGNGAKEAKAHADYVTDHIYRDGVYRALKHFGLI